MRFLVFIRFSLLLCCAVQGVSAETPFLWLGPNAESVSQLAEKPWPKDAAQHFGGVKLYLTWLRSAPQEKLVQLATMVREKNLKVSVELGGLLNHDWQDKIGELSAENELPPLRRWRDAGGRLDQVELDGPIRRAMGFAAWGKDPTKKITDFKVIGREIDEYLVLVAKEFPSTKFFLLVNFPNWGWQEKPSYHGRGAKQQGYGDYFEALTTVLPIVQAQEPKFSGLMIDNPGDYALGTVKSANLGDQSTVDWLGRIGDLCAAARKSNLQCGLILNSEIGGKTSDAAFASDTLAYAQAVVQRGLLFDQLEIQSWYPHPTNVVGDTVPAQMAIVAEVVKMLKNPTIKPMSATLAQRNERPIMGAIRWDFWTKRNEIWRESEIAAGKEKFSEYRNLQDPKWADRLPFFAKVVSENPRRIDIYQDSQEVMDQEIAFAKQSGLDYWAFLYYHNVPELNKGLDLYRKSAHRADIKYALILGGVGPYTEKSPWTAQITMAVGDARQPNYQRVLANRPLVFIFLWGGEKHTPIALWGSVANARAAMDALRAAFRQAGLGNPYIVAMRGDVKTGNEYREQLGLDALTAYTTFGKTDNYAGVAASNVAWWEQAATLRSSVILPVSCGWGGPNQSKGKLQQPTAEQFKEQVRTARRWIDEHPTAAPSRALLFYAWNEFDEGGFLCPILGQKEGDRKIDWLRSVIEER